MAQLPLLLHTLAHVVDFEVAPTCLVPQPPPCPQGPDVAVRHTRKFSSPSAARKYSSPDGWRLGLDVATLRRNLKAQPPAVFKKDGQPLVPDVLAARDSAGHDAASASKAT